MSIFTKRGGLWVVAQSAFMLAVAIIALPTRHQFDPFASQLPIALSLFALAAVVGVAGVVTLGVSRTPFPEPPIHADLVQTGIYRFMRHPLYTAVILWAFSWSLFWSSAAALIVSIALAFFFDAKARLEERLLNQRFAAYAQYAARVRRFIPFVY